MPVFIAALFTMAKGGNNPSVPQQMNEQNVVYTYNVIFFSRKKGVKF